MLPTASMATVAVGMNMESLSMVIMGIPDIIILTIVIITIAIMIGIIAIMTGIMTVITTRIAMPTVDTRNTPR